MTYREHCLKLHENVIDALSKHLKSEQKLASNNGFIDKSSFDKHTNAYADWQKAQNNFNSFLSFVAKNNINYDDEISQSV